MILPVVVGNTLLVRFWPDYTYGIALCEIQVEVQELKGHAVGVSCLMPLLITVTP
jgi:hypothetical protein